MNWKDPEEEGPWIPRPQDIKQLKRDLEVALKSDFRIMTYHQGLEIYEVDDTNTL